MTQSKTFCGKLLCVFLLFACCTKAFSALRYSEISPFAKKEICSSCVDCIRTCSVFIVKSKLSHMVYNAWDKKPCSQKEFERNIGSALFPCYSVVSVESKSDVGLCWLATDLPEGLLDVSRELSSRRQGAYRPALELPSCPLLAVLEGFSKEDGVPAIKDQGDIDLKTSDSKQLRCFKIKDNLAFSVDDLVEYDAMFLSDNLPISQFLRTTIKKIGYAACSSNKERPPITLTRQEATEFVYATALCKGKVKSAKEFNELYRDDNLGFIVELKSDRCETEFGRMLFSAVDKSEAAKHKIRKEKKQ